MSVGVNKSGSADGNGNKPGEYPVKRLIAEAEPRAVTQNREQFVLLQQQEPNGPKALETSDKKINIVQRTDILGKVYTAYLKANGEEFVALCDNSEYKFITLKQRSIGFIPEYQSAETIMKYLETQEEYKIFLEALSERLNKPGQKDKLKELKKLAEDKFVAKAEKKTSETNKSTIEQRTDTAGKTYTAYLKADGKEFIARYDDSRMIELQANGRNYFTPEGLSAGVIIEYLKTQEEYEIFLKALSERLSKAGQEDKLKELKKLAESKFSTKTKKKASETNKSTLIEEPNTTLGTTRYYNQDRQQIGLVTPHGRHLYSTTENKSLSLWDASAEDLKKIITTKEHAEFFLLHCEKFLKERKKELIFNEVKASCEEEFNIKTQQQSDEENLIVEKKLEQARLKLTPKREKLLLESYKETKSKEGCEYYDYNGRQIASWRISEFRGKKAILLTTWYSGNSDTNTVDLLDETLDKNEIIRLFSDYDLKKYPAFEQAAASLLREAKDSLTPREVEQLIENIEKVRNIALPLVIVRGNKEVVRDEAYGLKFDLEKEMKALDELKNLDKDKSDQARRKLIDAQTQLEAAIKNGDESALKKVTDDSKDSIKEAKKLICEEQAKIKEQERIILEGIENLDKVIIPRIKREIAVANLRLGGCNAQIAKYEDKDWFDLDRLFENINATKEERKKLKKKIPELKEADTKSHRSSVFADVAYRKGDLEEAIKQINEAMYYGEKIALEMEQVRKEVSQKIAKFQKDLEKIAKVLKEAEEIIESAREIFADKAAEVVHKRTKVPKEVCKLAILSLSNIGELAGNVLTGKGIDEAIDKVFDRTFDDLTGVILDKVSKEAVNKEAVNNVFAKNLQNDSNLRNKIKSCLQIALKEGFGAAIGKLETDKEIKNFLKEIIKKAIEDKTPGLKDLLFRG